MQAGCRLNFVLVAALLLAGCGTHHNAELVENELRARDFQLRDSLEEMNRINAENSALRMENNDLRKGSKILPEQAAQLYGLKRIALGRGTGGYDNDGLPGDEALMVFVEPHDTDDHIIKVPGQLQISVLEIDAQGLKTPLDCWNFDEEQMRQNYKQGLFSSGYQFKIPWKIFPQTENLRVVARLTLADGRLFETDRDIKVHLMPGAARPEPPPGAEPPPVLPLPFHSATPPAPAPVTQTSHWEPAPIQVELGMPQPITNTPTWP